MSLKADGLSFAYGARKVLKSVSFSAEYGEFISVLGPNGAGKSTLFRCMLGLLTPAGGDTFIDGKSVSRLTAQQLAGSIAYIPQSHKPVFNYSVFDMVLMGTAAQLGKFSSPAQRRSGMRRRRWSSSVYAACGIADTAPSAAANANWYLSRERSPRRQRYW